MDYSGHECIEEKGYWARAAEQMALGALTDEVTLAGTIGEIGLGFTNLDLPMDIRDITADLTVNFEPAELSWWGMMGLDCLAFLPAIGAFKYTDDAGTLVNRGVKSLKKNLDELGTGAKKAVNSLDHIIRAGKGKTDDIAGYVKTLTNRAEKKLDQVKKVWAGEEAVEGGLGIIEGDSGALQGSSSAIKTVNDLSQEQIDALIKYSGDDYANINRSLRGLEMATPENQATINAMKSALDNASLPKDMVLYRGTSTEALGNLKNLPAEELIGKQITEAGFMSTSTSSTVASGTFSGNLQIKIEASSGAHALDISSISQYSNEAEVLFNAGQKMTIISAESKNGILYITVLAQ